MREWERAGPLVRVLGATTAIGLVLGIVIGGIGGRIAMRILVMSSDARIQGISSDDGFVMGQFTAATFNLLATGALFGVVGGFTYLGVRPFMIGPPWARMLTCGAAAGAVLGALIVSPDGVDFTRLSPVPLAVALFVAIPALFAMVAALAVEHALRPGGWASTVSLPVATAPLLVFLFPPLLIVIGLPVMLVLLVRAAARRLPAIRAVVHHRVSFWGVRVGWGGVAAFGLIALIEDLLALA